MQDWSFPLASLSRTVETERDDTALYTPSLRALQSMDDWRFEQFVADLWEEMGYRTTVRRQSRDGGIDVLARKRGPSGATKAIQAKRYEESTSVGGPEVQQYFAMKYQVGADEGLIVTTGRFTTPAEDRASELGVRLVDGPDLARLIRHHASVEFYHRYREALGIDRQTIAEWLADRESRTLGERGRQAVAQRLGGIGIKVGTAITVGGRTLRTVRTVLAGAGMRLRGYEPVLRSEADDESEQAAADSRWGARFEAKGNATVERGFKRQEAPLVNWNLSSRAAVPLTGISPSLRSGPPLADRWVTITVVGIVAMLAAGVGTTVAFDPQGVAPLVFLLSLVGPGACAVGVVFSTALRSTSLAEIPRLGYALPVLVPLGIQLDSLPTLPLSVGWGLAIAGSLAFVIHTLLVRRLWSTSRWTLDDGSGSYLPVHEPLTVGSMAGSVVVATAVGIRYFDLPLTIPGPADQVFATAVSCGLCIVIIDATIRFYRGGFLGVVAGGILIGYGLLVGQTTHLVPSRVIVGSDVLLVSTLALVGAFMIPIARLRDRVLRVPLLLVGGTSVLAATAYLTARSTGIAQTRTVFQVDVLGYVAVGVSIGFYVTILLIERRAIADTLSRDTR